MFRSFRLVAVLAAVMIVSACGGGGGSSDPTPVVVDGNLEKPATLNLYPNVSATTGARLAVMVTSVGSVSVSMPLIFDTGSAGVTLYAPSIFPASMVSAAGFLFPAGQTSISYNGITVTDQQGTRTYGSSVLHSQTGNIGYAQLTFGDAQGKIATQVMPVFLYYSAQNIATGAPIEPVPGNQGIFGVASTFGTIVVPGSVEPAIGYPACALATSGTCLVASAFKFLQYGTGVNAGFMLTPAPIQTCDITTAGSCRPAAMLTVGLTPALESGFSTVSLVCPPAGYLGPATINGYPPCQKTVEDATLAVSGPEVGSITGGVVFDTGTSVMQIAPAAGAPFPATVAAGSTVMVTTPSGFTYTYESGAAGPSSTSVITDATNVSIVGIGYFTTNSYFVDFSSSITGWK
jgi:hypothetical protein